MNASDGGSNGNKNGKKFGVYFHVPFCRAPRCAYCDFYSTLLSDSGIEGWLEAVQAECIDAFRTGFDESWTVSSLFFGGGTPSLLAPEMIAGLLETVSHCWAIEPGAEITIECNPEDLNRRWAGSCLEAGVNRLSVGVQSFDQDYLAAIGRCHRPDKAAQALTDASKAGFAKISADLILGGPGSSEEVVLASVERALKLGVEHLSIYGYHLDPPATGYGQARFSPVSDEQWSGQYLAVCALLKNKGWRHYEISNWARSDTAISSHNMTYWLRKPYLGLGPSAHSYGPDETRTANLADLERWLAAARGADFSAVREVELLDRDTVACERVILGLRLHSGVELKLLEQLHGAAVATKLELLADKGLASIRDGQVSLTAKGFLLYDSIAGQLLPAC